MEKTKILIVDDRPENIFTLESILQEPHREFLNATSGAEALIMTKLEPLDLILLDYNLDDMSGMQVAEILRSNPETMHIPIIFVTAMSKSERRKMSGFEPGTVDVLFKPIEIEEAITKVAVFEKISLLMRKIDQTVKQ